MNLNSTNTTNKNLGFQSSSGVGVLAYSQINYIPGGDGLAAIYVKKNSEAGNYYYTYKDHLGSILTLTDDQGGVVYEQNFDAWEDGALKKCTVYIFSERASLQGRLRNADTWAYSNSSSTDFAWLNRGYTGHSLSREERNGKQLPQFALVNMNNRLYDPLLGRFLAVDNYVQDPFSSQGYNRFSYCFNNPLKYTDPSGERASTDFWMYNYLGFNNNGGEPTYDGGTKPPVIIDGNENENEGESIASNEMRMPTVSYGGNVNIYSFSSKRNFNNSWNFINPISTIPLKSIQPLKISESEGSTIQTTIPLAISLASIGGSLGGNGTGGGGVFANETDAYKTMWANSFDSQGNPYRESSAWLTDKGVLVSPQTRNTSTKSYNNYYPVSKVKADGYRYVSYKNQTLKILGQVHTHPNGFNSVPSDPADYLIVNYLKGLPTFVISHSSVYMGQIFNGVNTPVYIGTRENLLNGNMSLYGW